MEKKKIEWIEILFWIIIIVLFAMILTRIFGSSATDIQIYLGFMTSIVTIMIFIAKHYRETGEIKTEIRHSFMKVKEEINRIENKINNLTILIKSKKAKIDLRMLPYYIALAIIILLWIYVIIKGV